MEHTIRRARTRDIRAIAGLVADNVASGRVLRKATVTLYEDVQEFWVAERGPDHAVVGCGALHVMWEDLAEIRTVAVQRRAARARASATAWWTRCWTVPARSACSGSSC